MFRTPIIIRKSPGFALIVTLSLMILLTVVAVGLLTLSSISMRASGQGQAMATARANARMAMMLALGDLQKHTGPDQRVTARADIATGAGNPFYTGVWNSKPDASNPNAPLDKTTPLAWLVSGNNASGLKTTSMVTAANGGAAVTAPLQEVKSTATSPATGAFAYWVGDEGLKARINLDSPGYRTAATAKDASYAFAGAPRAAIELMETAASPATGTVTSAWGGNLYPYIAETASKLITTGQVPLYAAAGSQTNAQAAAKARFHDLTAYSSSVLSNTADGGLRQDLTRILSDSAKPGPADSASIFPADTTVSPATTETYRLPPTWGRLREWWNKPIAPSNNPNDPWNDPQATPKLELTPSLASATTPPIAPVVVWAEVGFAFFSEDLSTATPPGSGYRLRMQVFPRAVLWNPYTVPMAGRSYELGIGSEITGDEPNFTFQDAAGTEICRFYTNRYSFKLSAPRRYIYFNITVPTLQPGQTQVLSLANTMGNELTKGDNPGNFTILNASADDWFDTPLKPARFTIPPGLPTGPNFGGSNNFYLRDTGQPAHGSNMGTFPTKIFQFSSNSINQPGITGTNSPVSLPPPGTYAPQPNFRVANVPNMDNRNPVRWLDQLNLLAPILVRHPSDGTWSPFYGCGIYSSSTSKLPTVSGTDEVSLEMTATGVRATKPSPNNNPATGTPYRLALREPRLPNSGLYQSIAHLQHAPLNDTGIGPTYVAGNSIKSPRIVGTATSVTGSATSATSPFYDSSYLINQALWDQYFFSTIPTTLTAAELATPGYKLPNARLQPLPSADPAKLKQHDTAAANLMLSGGFNINSTSEQAWRAMLGAAYDLKYNPVTGALTSTPTDPLQSKFSRFLKPFGDSADPYRGYRKLSDAQIAAMAARLVTEVKTRGPFRSLADFVNRRLVDTSVPTDPAAALGLKGAVQAAIDYATGTNAAITNPQPFNIFSPGHVTQADVLSRIGSAISARSDTFVIRACGEARNGDTVTAKAYCEAVVQRTPGYVDPSTAPESMPAAGSINERFGRRFTIVSFRWLSPGEI